MYAAVFICLFSQNPSNLKLKIDGSIDIGQSLSGLRNSNGNTEIRAEKPSSNEQIMGVETFIEDSEESSAATVDVEDTTDKLIEREGNMAADREVEPVTDEVERPVKMREDKQASIAPTTEAGFTLIGHKNTRHKVQDDDKIRKFTDHVYKQTLKAFESMKRNRDAYTQQQIDSLAVNYKQKFTDFVLRTRQTDIKTGQGTRNVILHTIDTSNLILDKIVNFLKRDIIKGKEEPAALREGAALRWEKEVDTVRETGYEHACKKFGVCRSAQGFRTVLQDIISILLNLPDYKLIQANDAATEVLKNSDFTAISRSELALKRAIRILERLSPKPLRTYLAILFGAISKSHLPLIVDKGASYEKSAVKRTVTFRSFLDAIEVALPPTEGNKQEWGLVKNRLVRWKDDGPLDIQEVMQLFFDNVMRGVAKDEELKKIIGTIAESIN